MVDCCVFRLLDDMYDWMYHLWNDSSNDLDRFHLDEERPLVGYASDDDDADEKERIKEEKRKAKELQIQEETRHACEMRSVLAEAFKRGSKASAMYKASRGKIGK